MSTLFAFLPGLGMSEMLILMVLGVLLFGKRLPEVGRYLGKGLSEFKKGMKGLEDDFRVGDTAPVAHIRQEPQQPVEHVRAPQRVAATAPKFEDNLPTISTPPRA